MEIDKAAYFRMIGHTPHPKQWLFHNSEARFRLPICGRRFGKSTMAARDRGRELLIPNKRAWIVGPTYDLGEKEFRIIWDDLIVGRKLGQDRRVRKGYSVKQGNMFIEFPWRTRLEVRSADKPETLVGEGLDWVIVSEAAKQRRETWEKYIRPALADKRGSADFPTTPEGQNWIYDLWRLGQNPEHKEYESWSFPSWFNTAVFPGGENDPEIEKIRAETASDWFDQEYGASFTAIVGRIYPEWSEQANVKQIDFRPDWPNYIAFDWGYTNPLAAIEFQVGTIDGMEVIHVWREHYQSYKTLREHKKMLRERPNPPGYHLDLGFGDPADPEAVIEMQELVPTIAQDEARVNWRQGVETVRRFLKHVETGREIDEFGTPETTPRLFVDHKCRNVIREFGAYRGAPEPRTGTDPQEKPFKHDDHAMDALRYGLVHLFELGANRHLNEVLRVNKTMGLSPAPGEAFTLPTSYEEQNGVLVPVGVTTGNTIFSFRDGERF